MLKKRRIKSKKRTNGQRVARYSFAQFQSLNELCRTPHQYGDLHLIGANSIAGKTCKWCGHIIYREEIIERNERLRATRPATHVDLFQF